MTTIPKPRMRYVDFSVLNANGSIRPRFAWLCVGNGTYAYHAKPEGAYIRWRGKVAMQYTQKPTFAGESRARR